MKIKFGIGVEDILFGMTQEEIKSIWGEPNRINTEEKEQGIVYYFNSKMVKLKFDLDEDSKLSSIEVHNPKVKIFNRNVFLKTKEEIKSLLKSNGYINFEYEDYEIFDTFFCEDIWATFEFEFDRLISIEFSPLYKNDDERIWPNREAYKNAE